MNKMKQKEIAKILEIGDRQVRVLTARGILTKDAEGLYNVKETIQAYTNFKNGDFVADGEFESGSLMELEELLKQAKSSVQHVQITRDFWLGKINKLKYEEQKADLIPMNEAKAAVEMLLTPLNQYMNDQAYLLKSHFPNVSDEIVKWIDEENNRQKIMLQTIGWEE